MFDYTTERIVNGAGAQATGAAKKGVLLGSKVTVNVNGEEKGWNKIGFLDGWNFDAKDNANIEVYVHPYEKEESEVVTFEVDPGEVKDIDTVRLTVVLKQETFLDAELQNPLTRPEKTYMYDVDFGTKADIGAAIEKAYKEQTNLSQNAKFELKNVGGTLTITMKDPSYSVKDIKFEAVKESTLGIESTTLIKGDKDKNVTTKGTIGFGTPSWILNNFRLPTPEHTGWETMHKDERPEPNGKYCQVTFIVTKDRAPLTGSATVGQKLTSTTTHVLYVESAGWANLAAALKAEDLVKSVTLVKKDDEQDGKDVKSELAETTFGTK